MLSSIYNKACLVEYLGSNYGGWQRQKNCISIQSVIEAKLSHIYNCKILTVGSGRTDKGVHSFGQVFNYISTKYIKDEKIVRGLNALLPDDIKIIATKDVDITFNSLCHAISKTYAYKIINRPVPLAIDNERALWIRTKIDIDILKKALNKFIGEHDFASFCVTKTKKENTIRIINYINIDTDNDKIIITINANGFLHNMVRIIVGTALDIAMNKKDIKTIDEIMDKKDRRLAGKTSPATALYQLKIYYPDNNLFDSSEKVLLRRL